MIRLIILIYVFTSYGTNPAHPKQGTLTECRVKLNICREVEKCDLEYNTDKREWEDDCEKRQECKKEWVTKWCDVLQRKFNSRYHYQQAVNAHNKCVKYLKLKRKAQSYLTYWGPSLPTGRGYYRKQVDKYDRLMRDACNKAYPNVQPVPYQK